MELEIVWEIKALSEKLIHPVELDSANFVSGGEVQNETFEEIFRHMNKKTSSFPKLSGISIFRKISRYAP